MRAAVLHGINDVRIEDYKRPRLGKGEVLLKVEACAVCGTDLRIIRNGHKTVKPPAIIGHEVCGVVQEIGEGVSEFSIGNNVVVVTPVGCRNCKFCKSGYQNMCETVSKEVHSIGYYCNGGFSEYMLIPSEAVTNGNLIKFNPNGLPFEEISLVEPLSCVINGQRFLDIEPDETVAIFGCGSIGCLHASMARYLGAKIIMIDNNQKRLDLVERLKIADHLINSADTDLRDEIAFLTGGEGVDVAITACSSSEAQKSAFEITGIRGRISLFGGVPADERLIFVDSNDIHYLEKSVFGAFASCHDQYHEALKLILGKKVSLGNFITVFSLEDFHKGTELINQGAIIKAVIKPNGKVN